MGKRRNNTAIPTGSKVIENLKILNIHFVKDGAECRKQIEQLLFQLDSLAAERETLEGIEREVLELVLSSTLREAGARAAAEMAAATERERDLMKKVESATAELNALKLRRLLAVVTENDERKKELADLRENRRSIDQAESAKIGKKWLFPVAASAIFVATAVTLWCRSCRVRN